jgi:hypothetical protein
VSAVVENKMTEKFDVVKFVRENWGPESNEKFRLADVLTVNNIQIELDLLIRSLFTGDLDFVVDSNKLTVEEVLKVPNAELRTHLIRNWKAAFPESGSTGFPRFIADGGGELYMSPQGEDDYQDGEIYKLEVEANGQKRVGFALKLNNQTIEPGAENLSAAERLERGLTENGVKIYVLCLLDMQVNGESVPCGEYFVPKGAVKNDVEMSFEEMTGLLIPSVRTILEAARFKRGEAAIVEKGAVTWMKKEEAQNQDKGTVYYDWEKYCDDQYDKVRIPFKNIMDAVGWTWQLNPGEYRPDVES